MTIKKLFQGVISPLEEHRRVIIRSVFESTGTRVRTAASNRIRGGLA